MPSFWWPLRTRQCFSNPVRAHSSAVSWAVTTVVVVTITFSAEAIAVQLEAGAVSLNDAALTALFYEAEKHAFGLSGLGGSRMGAAGFHRFLRRRALIANDARPLPLSAFAEDA